jgi:hypothetical protein
MYARTYHHDTWYIREGILMFAVQVSEIGTVAGISRVLYDLTSKPPGILQYFYFQTTKILKHDFLNT